MSTSKPCMWKPCKRQPCGFSPYCAEHAEEARRNVLRSLGIAARASLMWRDGDEKWLLPEMGFAGDPEFK